MAQNFDTYNGKLTGERLDMGALAVEANAYTEPSPPGSLELDPSYNLHHVQIDTDNALITVEINTTGAVIGYIQPMYIYIYNNTNTSITLNNSSKVRFAEGNAISIVPGSTAILPCIFDGKTLYCSTHISVVNDQRPI